ncbi:MAG: peptide-methionine (S)-S-oxide reductase MsrA [Ignavibacteria bacterium]|nr:peptide-methionine (S)-S-oxide reductase MsrA [Ignavibacteria bacterium]
MNKTHITIIFLAILGLVVTAFGVEGEDKTSAAKVQKATFAGGCFWCMQPPFDRAPGVISTVVGYTGGTTKNPTYEEVSSGRTEHAESIEITFDPTKISYDQLLDIFWRNIDPTTPNRQFADVGTQYRTAIFYHGEEQKKLALESKRKLNQSGKFDSPIATEIVPASTFYPAEEYHQKYYLKNSAHYKAYRKGSGREGYLKKTWGDEAEH